MIHNESIQAIVIATSAHTHYDLAHQALVAGKHVFVEKPITLNVDQGQELADLAQKHNLTLMVGHLVLYHILALIMLRSILLKMVI